MNTPSLPRQFALDISHTPKASLENYLPGKDRALVETLKILCNSWENNSTKGSSNPLNHRWMYWWGPEGSGRSHLLEAVAHAAERTGLDCFSLNPSEPVSWVRLEEKLLVLVQSEAASVITVDDVDRLDDRLIGALFRILNEVQASRNIHIFIAGNAAPANLTLREDLRTRLGWGLIFQTQLLDDDEKIQALEQAAKARGLVLSPDVLPWLLNRFYRDMPNLMALIDALDAYSLETKRAVTLPLVRELLQPK
ncbi:DnaA regulatory inactivator Hda [Polynucleobacter wuianus]|uniref:DnaA regulatory inactivator Hda n=1 Tax=Polynucleobacter wuianus TaxID=1743168 RepID=A0A191UH51_9BURK|nr:MULTISPECIES: DnaA regulatory inactivator Hda [Polynucleobacter]ANJ00340.1 DnaA regulatory inactivator Hda [Polynucleobacter wuianus]MBU3552909.1 DnaA regulatory inactivator Hda [Polynucleobacter sp. MWH-Post4-6-1]MBU3609615.1 DnaA regulatory inactivator Hda [Polynucleobacter wuianus]